jgi:3-oxoacyl-[acyl-carrier protein] reductase
MAFSYYLVQRRVTIRMNPTIHNNRRGRVEGLSAIVTGSSRGIGRATALALAREGSKVVVNYRQRRREAEEVVELIQRAGGDAFPFQADVANRGAVQEMVAAAVKRFGGVDILVNNAGVGGGGGPLLELKEGDLDVLMETNVKGMLFCCQSVVPHMREKRYGKIVNIASIAGVGTAIPGTTLYAATKAAMLILTKRFALELGSYGITVNAIAPGHILTDMTVEGRSPTEVQERSRYFEEHTMLRREGAPEDIAHAVLFLASDEASFVTGQILTVDGGRIDLLTHSL